MRRFALTTTLFAATTAAALVLTGCTTSTEPDAEVQTEGISYLWALGATDGSLVQSDTAMFLELTGVAAAVTRFSDRPAREASEVDVRDFLGRWEGRFAEVPPNAVLSYQADEGAAPVQLVVEISRPRFDEASSTLVFAAKVIDGTPDELEGADHPVADHEPVVPTRTGPVSLFIDSEGPDAKVSDIATLNPYTLAVSDAVLDTKARVAAVQGAIHSTMLGMLDVVQARNQSIAELESVLAVLNRLLATVSSVNSDDSTDESVLTPSDLALLDVYGFADSDRSTKGAVDALIDDVRSTLDFAVSEQSSDMIRIQQMLSSSNEQYEAVGNLITTTTDSYKGLVANLD